MGCARRTAATSSRSSPPTAIKTTDEGTLFKTRLKTFHASYAGRQERGEENGYVFCSPTRPAIMAEQNGQTMAFFLAPFATQESRESVRKNANFHALYFAICHGREAGKAAVHNLAGVAQSHGYRVALAQSKLVPLKRAEDVLTMAGDPNERAPVEARQDERTQSVPRAEARREERFERLPSVARRNEARERPPVEARRYERLDRAQEEPWWDEPRDRPPADFQVGLSARAALPLRNSGMSAGSVHRRRQWAESTRSIVSPGGRLRPVLSMRTGRRGSYPAHVG